MRGLYLIMHGLYLNYAQPLFNYAPAFLFNVIARLDRAIGQTLRANRNMTEKRQSETKGKDRR